MTQEEAIELISVVLDKKCEYSFHDRVLAAYRLRELIKILIPKVIPHE